MKPLPEWMRPETPCEECRTAPASKRRTFARQAIGSFAALLSSALVDDTAMTPGLLQSIDPRAKVLGLVGLVVVATLVHNPISLVICYGVCAVVAALSRVPLRRLMRVWLLVPLLSMGVMLPATLNVITEGRHVWTLWRFASDSFGPYALPETLAVTDAGLMVLGRFVLRAAVCIFLVVLLTSTTRPARLFRGLRILGAPQVFVMLLAMMQRYVEVLARAAEEIHLAKISRGIAEGSVRQEQAWVASGMGSLFRRTRALGGAVYLAMISRGYTGEAHLLDEPKWRARDWGFLACAIALAAVMLITA